VTASKPDFNTTEHHAVLGLGSNVGSDSEKWAALRAACGHLSAHPAVRITARSSVYRTPPWGETDQPEFLNAAVRVATRLDPADLLDAVKAIEHRMGRVPTYRWGPRVIDIDILLYDMVLLDTPPLTIPHRHLLARDFACLPALEADPDAVLPGGVPLREAAAGLFQSAVLERVGPL
jgi:2-amino-4-hydroxy-6-hydroxymethyldihydropteridine diphosphokinase